jgi:hypothetical protein
MRRITNPQQVPFGGAFKYQHIETGTWFQHHSLDYLKDKVKKFHRENNFPIGPNFDANIENQVCLHHPDSCSTCEEPGLPPTRLQLIIQFARAMAQWVGDGLKIVPSEVFSDRKLKCQACPYWGGDHGAFYLARCTKCGCSGLKLHLPSEECPDEPKRWLRYHDPR